MNEIITEKNYPIQITWIFKSLIGIFFIFIILVPISIFATSEYLIYYLIISVINVIILVLRRKNFHYALENEFLTLKQGILSKQQRHIPYGVVQNIFVKQGILDRIFGLSSLTLENASSGGGLQREEKKIFGMRTGSSSRQAIDEVGFGGNMVSIPGLKKNNAEILKGLILQKMKENPMRESHSGL